MYRTVREGDAVLPPEQPVDPRAPAMTLRLAKRAARGARGRWGCGPCGPCSLRTRPLLLLGAVLALGSCAVLAAALLPALASASDLEAALQNAFAFGGAGRTARFNPNVHHPPDLQRYHAARPARPARRNSGEDDEDDAGDYPALPPGQEVAVAMESAPEVPVLPQQVEEPTDAVPLSPSVKQQQQRRPLLRDDDEDDDDDDEDDDDDDDDSPELRDRSGPPRRVLADGVLLGAPQPPPPPPPPGLPPSLLPQRRAAHGLPVMLDPVMGDNKRVYHKTNNGLYTNEDDLDHNILDLTRRQQRGPQRAAHASTRIFVEALLPSIDQPGEPAAPQRRSWTPATNLFHWTDEPVGKKLVFSAGIVVGLCVCLSLIVFVRRRRKSSSRCHSTEDAVSLSLTSHPSATQTATRRETRVDEVRGADVATTRDLLDGSEEEA